MIKIGRRIYYEKDNGIIIYDKGDRQGTNIVEQTIEEDKINMPILDMLGDKVGVLNLQYGDYSEEFKTGKGYRVNPITQKIEFGGIDIITEPLSIPVFDYNTYNVAVGENININITYQNLYGINTSINKTVQILINDVYKDDLNIVNGEGLIEFTSDKIGTFVLQIENKTCEVTVNEN